MATIGESALRPSTQQGGSVPGRDAYGRESDVAFRDVIGSSLVLRRAVSLARNVGHRRATTILSVGETGTGKGTLARNIHRAGSTADEPFVPVNCAAIPGSLIQSELFGHERGAFTGARYPKKGLIEIAGAGTLFFDEVSELPIEHQPKLLRVLEKRRFRRVGGLKEIAVRCGIIAAANTPLEEAVAGGRLRQDLYYRINVLRMHLPPFVIATATSRSSRTRGQAPQRRTC